MRLTLITLIAAIAFLTGACNTVQGMGKDVQAGGKKLEDSAEKNKNKKSCGCNM